MKEAAKKVLNDEAQSSGFTGVIKENILKWWMDQDTAGRK